MIKLSNTSGQCGKIPDISHALRENMFIVVAGVYIIHTHTHTHTHTRITYAHIHVHMEQHNITGYKLKAGLCGANEFRYRLHTWEP